jgi:hypothetical protein
VGVLAVQVLRTVLPTAIVVHVGALVEVVEVEVGRTAEVLLAVGIVALRPLVLFIDVGAEAGFVGVDHELTQIHVFLVQSQVPREPLVAHQVLHSLALLRAERQRVYFLLLFVQRLDSLQQVARFEGV